MVAKNTESNEAPLSTGRTSPVDKKKKRSWSGFFRDIVLYLLIYVVVSGVSIGPLFWTWFGAVYADGPKFWARFYMPLLLLCEYCPPLGRLVNAWINWWIL